MQAWSTVTSLAAAIPGRHGCRDARGFTFTAAHEVSSRLATQLRATAPATTRYATWASRRRSNNAGFGSLPAILSPPATKTLVPGESMPTDVRQGQILGRVGGGDSAGRPEACRSDRLEVVCAACGLRPGSGRISARCIRPRVRTGSARRLPHRAGGAVRCRSLRPAGLELPGETRNCAARLAHAKRRRAGPRSPASRVWCR